MRAHIHPHRRHVAIAAPLLVLLLCAAGCRNAPPAAAPPVSVPPDRSLTLEEYSKLGMPPCTRVWGPQDYVTAAKVLRTLAAEDATRLPRANSDRSGPLFARFVTEDNFKTASEAASLDARMPKLIGLWMGVHEAAKVYYLAGQPQKVFDEEVAGFLEAQLRPSRPILSAVEEFLKTLPADDPKQAVRREGLAQMKQGMGELLNGALECLTERQSYRLNARRRLVYPLRETAPTLFRVAPPDAQRDALARLEKLVAEERDSLLKRELEAMLTMVREQKPAGSGTPRP